MAPTSTGSPTPAPGARGLRAGRPPAPGARVRTADDRDPPPGRRRGGPRRGRHLRRARPRRPAGRRPAARPHRPRDPRRVLRVHGRGRHSSPPSRQRDVSRRYRRWAFESAALDLALRQAGTGIAEALGREPRPVNFVCSMRLGARARTGPPRSSPCGASSTVYPTLRFKLDPTNDWTDELIAELVETGRGRLARPQGLLQGHRRSTSKPTPSSTRKLIEAFPDAWLEDPDVTDETRPLLDPVRDRVTWDAPIHSIADIEALPWCRRRWSTSSPRASAA